jgi:hypothetical protein
LAIDEQGIAFAIDKGGVHLASEARVAAAKSKNAPSSRYHFDRPYLIVLQMKGATNPFFVMWVANAELMQPR